MRDVRGGDAARLLGAPSLAACDTPAAVAVVAAEAARATEARRWIELGGLVLAAVGDDPAAPARGPSPDLVAALEAATPDHPACLWTADRRGALLNAAARRFAKVDVAFAVGAALDAVRRVLPRWTLEVWKDRLDLLQRDLLARGVREIRDLDAAAAEGWRVLEDERLLLLDRVDVTYPAAELRRRIREGSAAASDADALRRVRPGGVVFDLDRAAWPLDRVVEELALARDAGVRPILLASSPAARRVAASALGAVGPFPPDCVPASASELAV